jgi:hypothetical protein
MRNNGWNSNIFSKFFNKFLIFKTGPVFYPPSQKAPSGRAGVNAKRVSAIALAKADLLRRVPQKM